MYLNEFGSVEEYIIKIQIFGRPAMPDAELPVEYVTHPKIGHIFC